MRFITGICARETGNSNTPELVTAGGARAVAAPFAKDGTQMQSMMRGPARWEPM